MLALLHTLGGPAKPDQLMPVLPREYKSIGKIVKAIDQLEQLHLVRVEVGQSVSITENGCEYLEHHGAVPTPTRYVGKVAQVREAPEFKPMCISYFRKMMGSGPQRAGMDDLRSVPSLIGGHRVSRGVRDK
ncbi:hypothetical protein [Collimonas fungivorans]|uniref:hypothetical protein n=1 Tax=Collimonas fungivorans TaxID=158899 RepID=UPI0011D2A76E|nr:hypothetical protein [Collimonas fungivorans]